MISDHAWKRQLISVSHNDVSPPPCSSLPLPFHLSSINKHVLRRGLKKVKNNNTRLQLTRKQEGSISSSGICCYGVRPSLDSDFLTVRVAQSSPSLCFFNCKMGRIKYLSNWVIVKKLLYMKAFQSLRKSKLPIKVILLLLTLHYYL